MIILCIIKNILSEIYIEHRFDEANHRAVDIQSLCIGRHYEGKDEEFHLKRMSGIHLAIPVFSKGYRPKQGKVAP